MKEPKETKSVSDLELHTNTKLLERFFLKEMLRKGSYGLVYSGVDMKTNKQIAIKLVR